MTKKPCAATREEISKWIEAAASPEPSYRYPATGAGSLPGDEGRDFHAERIEASLFRARSKTFVRMLKPFRGIFRNQGAVNDSLIEAVHHLAAQNEEIMERMNELRLLVSNLRSQMRRTHRGEALSQDDVAEDAEGSATSGPAADPIHSSNPETPDRKA